MSIFIQIVTQLQGYQELFDFHKCQNPFQCKMPVWLQKPLKY